MEENAQVKVGILQKHLEKKLGYSLLFMKSQKHNSNLDEENSLNPCILLFGILLRQMFLPVEQHQCLMLPLQNTMHMLGCISLCVCVYAQKIHNEPKNCIVNTSNNDKGIQFQRFACSHRGINLLGCSNLIFCPTQHVITTLMGINQLMISLRQKGKNTDFIQNQILP